MIVICADVHVGNRRNLGGPLQPDGLDGFGTKSLTVFRKALMEARKLNASHFIVAGDMFHSRRPEPAVIAAVAKAIQATAGKMKVIIVPGNHDLLDATAEFGNMACEPLFPVATIVRDPTWVDNMLLVPFQAKEPMSDYLESVIAQEAERANKKSILITHVGLYDDSDPPWCRTAPDAMHATKMIDELWAHGFGGVFVGNFHQHRKWLHDNGTFACQIGTLCPGSWGDKGEYPDVGGMALLYPENNTYMLQEIPGPRFVEGANGEETYGHSPEGHWYAQPKAAKPESKERVILPRLDNADAAIEAYISGLSAASKDDLSKLVRQIWLKSTINN